MFRFIHAADLHLDSPMLGLEEREGAPVEKMRGATRRAVENLVQLAIDERVDFVVVAGDLYDGDWKDYRTGLFLRRELVRLNNAGIPAYLIHGNHDAGSEITRTLLPPEQSHFFSTARPETKAVPGLPVVIHGRSFPNRAVPENWIPDYPAPVPGKFNLGLLHTSLNGREGHDNYCPCSVPELSGKGYDYWALGHIHQPEIVAQDPWIVYSGNIQGRSVRETGPRGCRLVSVDDQLKVTGVEWRDLDVFRWAVLNIDLTDCRDRDQALQLTRARLSELVARSGERAVAVRLVFSGPTPLHGSLHGARSQWEADCHGCVQDCGLEQLWLERVKLATRPAIDLRERARTDGLTRTVLEAIDQFSQSASALPEEVNSMLGVLPPELKAEISGQLDRERPELLAEVSALLLQTLGTTEERDA